MALVNSQGTASQLKSDKAERNNLRAVLKEVGLARLHFVGQLPHGLNWSIKDLSSPADSLPGVCLALSTLQFEL